MAPSQRGRQRQTGRERFGLEVRRLALASASIGDSPGQHAREKRVALVVLTAALSLGFALRVWLALSADGMLHPDEVYQSLEPAHRAVFGYGLISWEFMAGARNWAFPGLVAGLLKIATLLGLDSPDQYLMLMRVAFSAVGIATAFGVYQLARTVGAGPMAAACAAAMFALTGLFVYLGPRALSDAASALLLVFGFACTLRKDARQKDLWLGGSLLGLAVLIRLQSVFFCLALLALLVVQRRRRAVLAVAAVLVFWALLYGLIDKLAWGQWFRSAIVYLRFNVVDTGGAALYGTQEPLFYPRVILTSMGPMAVLLAALWLLGARRAFGLSAIIAGFILALSFVPHKELRFVLPSLTLACAVAGLGVQQVMHLRVPLLARWTPWGALVLVLFSATTFPSLTVQSLGYMEQVPEQLSALDFRGPENRLLLAAGAQLDLCGLQVQTAPLYAIGGYTYLHRPVPLYPLDAADDGHFNYVIARRGTVAGAEVALESDLALVRLPRDGCADDQAYGWGL